MESPCRRRSSRWIASRFGLSVQLVREENTKLLNPQTTQKKLKKTGVRMKTKQADDGQRHDAWWLLPSVFCLLSSGNALDSGRIIAYRFLSRQESDTHKFERSKGAAQ